MKKTFAIIFCVIMVLSLFGCGATKEAGSVDFAAENFKNEQAVDVAEDTEYGLYNATESVKENGTGEKAEVSEKIIKTVDASIITKEYDAYIATLNASVTACGGYIESSDANYGAFSDSSRYSNYVVRIPSDKLNDFLAAAEEKGKITDISEKQENVTLEYVDLESRIEAYKTERETLTELLKKAETLDNVLAVQDRLTEVNYQIESYTSKLKVLENRVSYSTVTLSISEVERVSENKPTVWSRIKDRFSDNLDNLVEGFKDAVVEIIGGLPVIIPVAVCIAVFVLIIRKIIRKRKG